MKLSDFSENKKKIKSLLSKLENKEMLDISLNLQTLPQINGLFCEQLYK